MIRALLVIAMAVVSFFAGFYLSERNHIEQQDSSRTFIVSVPQNLPIIKEVHPTKGALSFHSHATILSANEGYVTEYYIRKGTDGEDAEMTQPVRRTMTEDEMDNFRHLPFVNVEE